MQYGICSLSVIPLRAEPSDRAEMVNQVLFGESFEILEKQPKWSLVKLSHDNYEGWLDNKQIFPLERTEYERFSSQEIAGCTELIEIVSDKSTGNFFPVMLGSLLPGIGENREVTLGSLTFDYTGAFSSRKSDRAALVEFAYQYMHAPYLWGGRTPMGIDCSGFSQMVYRLSGYTIPRDSKDQAKLGQTLSFIEESLPGDLAFFDNEEGEIVHVGIMLKENHILHASGMVRLDRLDQTGIFNSETGKHTHNLRVIKKII